MPATPKNKVFYQIHEAKERLGLSMLDMAVLVAERKLLLSAALGGILVEDGILQEQLDFGCTYLPLSQNFVHGLVDLRPEDGWEVLRAGSHTINLLAAEKDHYRRLIDSKSNASGRLVTREDVGLRHEELTRYLAFEQSLEDAAPTVRQEKRRAPTAYDWEEAQLEAFRLVYFDGVPPSFGALIRHIQGWYIAKGGYRVENRKLLIDEAAATTVRRVFEGFADIGSATRLLPVLRAEGLLTKHGRPFDKGAVYKLLVNRVYLGEAVHKGNSYPGEHAAIVPKALWNQVHEIMASNPHMRAGLARNRSPALLRGLIFGADGRALSPTHTRKQGRLYRYYVSQSVLKGGADDAPYRRLPAGEIEALMLEQVRALLRQPEVVVGTWRAVQAEAPDLAEDAVRDALARFDPVWSELFPAEQERLIRLLVQRVVVGEAGAQISLNLEGLASLARDLSQPKRIAA